MTRVQRAERIIQTENARLRSIMAKERKDVLAALKEIGPMTASELRVALGWLGYRVADAVQSAVKRGLVAQDDSGRYCLTGK